MTRLVRFEKLASRLLLVHLKDVAGRGAEQNVLLGQGIARIPDCMQTLKRVQFRGLVAIEYEKDSDSSQDMRTLVHYARARA